MKEVPFAIGPIGSRQDKRCISSEESKQMLKITMAT